MLDLADIFSPGGALAARLPGFSYREAQERMAQLVVQALDSGRHVAIEAGTGIGKTFAYLLPVLLSGRHAIISTGTRTLQDQLFARDLPLLGAVVGRPARVALLKGRNNYLCWHRLENARHDGTRDAETVAALRALAEWGHASDSGDLTELEDLAEDHALRSTVTSTVDNCLGSRCEHYDSCFVVEARRRAQAADIVIVNHHLLLADLALKESGFGEFARCRRGDRRRSPICCPTSPNSSSASRLAPASSRRSAATCTAKRRPRAWAQKSGRALGSLGRLIFGLRHAAAPAAGRLPWLAAPAALREALADGRQVLDDLAALLESLADASAGLRQCSERCADGAARLRTIVAADADLGLRWVDCGAGYVAAHWTPLDVGTALAARIEAQGGACVHPRRCRRRLRALAESAPRRAHDGAAEPVRLRAQCARLHPRACPIPAMSSTSRA
jgi:ATP-dependent DNA helicase DinG